MATTTNLARYENQSNMNDERLLTLKSLQQIRRNIIGELDTFKKLFGPSNTLIPLSYSFQSKSKYEFVDFGYKLYREHEVLVGPIDMYGLCRSMDDYKGSTKLEADINEGKERLMMFISNCDNMANKPSGSLMSVILRDLADKLDGLLGNQEVVKKITSRYSKFDASAFARNRKNILQKYINGKENDACELVRLRVDVAPTRDENYTCYEISQGLSRSKGHFHFMPPMLRHGYLILKMPYIRAMVSSKSTDYLFKLNAKMIMVDKIEHVATPLCFDIKTGKVVDDTEAIFMLDGCSDVDWTDGVEGLMSLPTTREFSKLTAATTKSLTIFSTAHGAPHDFNDTNSKAVADGCDDDEPMIKIDKSFDQYKTLSCAIDDFIKEVQNEERWHPSVGNLFEFVNRFISVIKCKKTSLLKTQTGAAIINMGRIPELSAPADKADMTLEYFEDLVMQNYNTFRLHRDADEIMRSCWHQLFSHVEEAPEVPTKITKKTRSSTPTVSSDAKCRRMKR